MDIAYDHIQEEILSSNNNEAPSDSTEKSNIDLNTEFQETFRAFSASPWGTRIGGLWENVRKHGETYYEGARQEYTAASEEAVKGFADLRDSIVDRTKNLSLSTATLTGSAEGQKGESITPTTSTANEAAGNSGEGFISRFKAEAARRLKEIEKAEEAADEAILRFGLNISQRLREAVSIVPPDTDESGKLLFESKDADGKRVIHATRFDAQLHVIHSNLDSFTKDPVSDKYAEFKKDFNPDAKTADIAFNLDKYADLRSAMEKLVPEQVEYADFWARYFFLRLVIETEEQKRKELLKGNLSTICLRRWYANADHSDANAEDEEVAWDDDSDSESESPSTPQVRPSKQSLATSNDAPKAEARRSNDQQSQADSESSYDVVSGAASRTPNSPKEKVASDAKEDDSDEDWE